MTVFHTLVLEIASKFTKVLVLEYRPRGESPPKKLSRFQITIRCGGAAWFWVAAFPRLDRYIGVHDARIFDDHD